VCVGVFAGFDGEGRFQIDVDDAAAPIVALSTMALAEHDIGTPVVVAYESVGDRRPVILGRAHARRSTASTVHVDGDRVVIGAEREIELRCGDASIVLTRAGKLLIRGNYVISRSRGANKVKGAVVDIN
jgi:hypothetical protein